jgi:hypothetical protein
MKVKLLITHWHRGGVFHWGDWKFNGGDSYLSYRLGPLLVHIRKEA